MSDADRQGWRDVFASFQRLLIIVNLCLIFNAVDDIRDELNEPDPTTEETNP